MLLILQRSVNQ